MCCPYECQPQICSSNESVEEDCHYGPCCLCSAPREPCPPFRTPLPCPPRRPPRPCNSCPPPSRWFSKPRSPPPPSRYPPRPCSPCPPSPSTSFPPPCCPCKVKGKFGLAYIVETPKNRCETPLGWQIEFEDTPSKISSSCKKMMQWVNCPPLGECGTDAVMSGYSKKCARAFASNPKSCCYEDETPTPCDCESEPNCCCLPKPQQKCCKPRPQRRKPCCCPPPQHSCCCGKQEREKYEEAGCSCCKKRGSNSPKGDHDSLDYVPDKEVLYKNKNGRENQKKEQRMDSKYVQHDQSHHGRDEETANPATSSSSILSGQLVHPDVLSASKNVLYSKNSLLCENNGKQNGNQDSALSARRNAIYSKSSMVGDSSNKQNGNQDSPVSVGENVSFSKNSVLSENNGKQNGNQDPALSGRRNAIYSKNSMVGDSSNKQNGNQDSPVSVGENVSFSKNSVLSENNGKQNGDQDPALSGRRNAIYSKNSMVDDISNKQNGNQNSPASNSVLDESNNNQNRNQYPTLSVGQLYGKNNLLSGINSEQNNHQGIEDNKADSTNKDIASHTTHMESEINIPVEDYNTLIEERLPNEKVRKMDYKTLREKIREARKHQVDVIHQEAEKLHVLEEKLKHRGSIAGKAEEQFVSRVSDDSNPNPENKLLGVSSQLNHTTESKTVDGSKKEIVGEATPEKQTDTRSSNQQVAETDKSSDIVGVKILIEVNQSKKQIERGNTMHHQLDVIKKASI